MLGHKEICIADLVAAGQGAIDGVKKRGKSEIGEKTLLDSLVPAVEAAREALAGGAGAETVIGKAIDAARMGMESTAGMKAKHSRASYRPDGGAGVRDPGATAVYLFIDALGQRLISCL